MAVEAKELHRLRQVVEDLRRACRQEQVLLPHARDAERKGRGCYQRAPSGGEAPRDLRQSPDRFRGNLQLDHVGEVDQPIEALLGAFVAVRGVAGCEQLRIGNHSR